MEKYIHAMMATLISFLTCLAPVYAMENFKHTFKCESQEPAASIELVGEFVGNKGVFAFKGAGPLKLFNEAEFTHLPRSRFGLQAQASGMSFHISQFYNAQAHRTEAAVYGDSIRQTVVSLVCKTSCTACILEYPVSEFCVSQCNCMMYPSCQGW